MHKFYFFKIVKKTRYQKKKVFFLCNYTCVNYLNNNYLMKIALLILFLYKSIKLDNYLKYFI